MNPSGTVYVVDDDPSMCEFIEAALRPAGLDVRSFPSAEALAAVNMCADAGHQPCCLLLDIQMPGISGLDFLEQRYPGGAPCPVVIISAKGSIKTAVKSMKLGAVDFLEKPFSLEELRKLVLETLTRHQCTCDRMQVRESIRTRLAALSPRERELLEAIVQGKSTKMIADTLHISARTVDHHRANLMAKMHAINVADLVRMAVEFDYRTVESSHSRNASSW